MRLYATKIPVIVDHVYKDLVNSKDVEVNNGTEFRQDVESILREYLRANREFTERAKDLLEARGLAYSDLYRTRRELAEAQDFGIGDEAPKWIANQLVELFMASNFVEEVYADDASMRKKLTAILSRHMQVDGDLDREVRKHLRHLSDGTEAFEIEYQKKIENFRRKHGLAE